MSTPKNGGRGKEGKRGNKNEIMKKNGKIYINEVIPSACAAKTAES